MKKLNELANLKVSIEVLDKSALKSIRGGAMEDCTNDATKGGTDVGNVEPGVVCCCACACKGTQQ